MPRVHSFAARRNKLARFATDAGSLAGVRAAAIVECHWVISAMKVVSRGATAAAALHVAYVGTPIVAAAVHHDV